MFASLLSSAWIKLWGEDIAYLKLLFFHKYEKKQLTVSFVNFKFRISETSSHPSSHIHLSNFPSCKLSDLIIICVPRVPRFLSLSLSLSNTHTHTHTHTPHTHTHTHTHTRSHTHTHARTHARMHAYTHAYIHTHTHDTHTKMLRQSVTRLLLSEPQETKPQSKLSEEL